VERDKVIS